MKRNCKWAILSARFGHQMASIMMLRCYRKEVSEGFHLKIKKIDKFIKDINLGGGSSSINYVLIKL